MQIRTRLTLQFTGIVALISLLAHLSIYFFAFQYRKNQFTERLADKAITTAELLLKVDQITPELLNIYNQYNKDILHKECIAVFNYRNEEVYSSNKFIHFNPDWTLLNEVRAYKEISWQEGEFEIVGVVYTTKNNRFVVLAGGIDIWGNQNLLYIRNILFTSYVIILLVVMIAGWIFSGRALKPIKAIISEVNTISATNLSTRLDEGNRKDELARLSSTFNGMLDRLENAFRLQKSFVANASHELKNPLTIIRSQIELSLLRERSPEEYRKTLQSVLEDMKNLASISDRLMQLTQLSADDLRIQFEPVRLDDLMWELTTECSAKHPEATIKFIPELPEDADTLIVQGDKHLLHLAFLNLIENGLKFSDPPAVKVTLKVTESGIVIQIMDKGIGIQKEDLKNIFQPFYRGNNTSNVSGHGIGLSIVQRIVTLHGMKIDVSSTPVKGTTFTVSIAAYKK